MNIGYQHHQHQRHLPCRCFSIITAIRRRRNGITITLLTDSYYCSSLVITIVITYICYIILIILILSSFSSFYSPSSYTFSASRLPYPTSSSYTYYDSL